ncbi:MAG: hypothetical protein FD152_3584 [Xanthobacteraceae bacterium]|nr:MAG: hypothetical protein FD152_3584 [Xanthobacteraceae bacterium]
MVLPRAMAKRTTVEPSTDTGILGKFGTAAPN